MNYQGNFGPATRTGRRPAAPGSRSGGGLGCGMFVLGFLAAVVIGAVAVFFLYFYNPNSNTPLSRPAEQAGVPDISATISQTYLNREISRQLSGQPFKAGGVEIRDIVVRIEANSQVVLDMQASSGPATFNLSVTEEVVVQNGQVKLAVVGQPRVNSGQLPPGVNSILDEVNTKFVEPRLNEQVTQIVINRRPVRLVGISSSTGLLTVRANIQ